MAEASQEILRASRFAIAGFLPIVVLFGVFLGVVLWFGRVDAYHQYFFADGPLVAADNAMRIGFVFLLAWLVYAPGAGIAALILPRGARARLTAMELAILGFGIGVGLWHAAMLVLGVLNLYYRPVMIGLASAVLLASAPHFAAVSRAAGGWLAAQLAELRGRDRRTDAIGVGIIVLVAAWLLLVRGLYPGGGHDYYTHYFYYYMEVINNHGLAPNDFWYHYYYSKGYGLFFFSMLLTDPEAPALVTFCCVAFAAAAIAALAARVAPRTMWPACATLIYLLFNLVGISHGGGGEFQKDHEQVTALVVLVTWALCMGRMLEPRLYVAAAAATGISVAIVNQPMGVILALYFALATLWWLLRRGWSDVRRHGLVAAAVGGTLMGIFALNFLATGLLTDQFLDFALRFADMSRLDRWGVIPQLVIVAWYRESYDALAASSWSGSFVLLQHFMRLELLWPFLIGSLTALASGFAVQMLRRRPQSTGPAPHANPATPAAAIGMLVSVGSLLALFIVLSLAVGRSQSGSFERFSSCYVPLLLLGGTVVCGIAMTRPLGSWPRWFLRSALPAAVLAATLLLWQDDHDWTTRVSRATESALRFFAGKDSRAEAYSELGDIGHTVGYRIGGINQQALAAWRHVEPGATIWAMNDDVYCMVPGCLIKSIFSSRMSPRLNEIIDGPPQYAKELLQKAGFDYFLFLGNAYPLDVLPYSRLFNPKTMDQYLGIIWTDGSAFLLTWKGPDTAPISSEFLDLYADRLAQPERPFPFFRFRELAPQLGIATERLRSKSWGEAPDFPWRDRNQR
jgi:hypothetical protein